ncbi:MAG: hypothetical protein HYR96_12895, partial [Deltaproteobacteria bacterium]|nr:hypothetical protein [Deltaproteobacteria bacterium]
MKIQFTTILFILALNGFALQSMVPKTHFEFWNDSQVVSGNNCYNYSTNRQTDSYAQPGEASDKKYDSLLCQNVVTAAEADLGLESTPYFPISERDEETLVALVVAPGYDYHWYRRDSSGWWTHKMGWLPATNLDNAKLPIPDPESADRGKYTDFCGYFKIRNFPTAQHQQNSGFVRIGNMKELPRVGEEPAPASPDP